MTDAPNYNDGNWHGWNGGECPVHPKSEVEAVWHDPNINTAGITGPRPAKVEGPTLAWPHVVKFRVVKEYREPREFWISKHNKNYILAHKPESNNPDEFIRVREVLE